MDVRGGLAAVPADMIDQMVLSLLLISCFFCNLFSYSKFSKEESCVWFSGFILLYGCMYWASDLWRDVPETCNADSEDDRICSSHWSAATPCIWYAGTMWSALVYWQSKIVSPQNNEF